MSSAAEFVDHLDEWGEEGDDDAADDDGEEADHKGFDE